MSRMLALLNATLVCPLGGVSQGGVLVENDRIVATGLIDVPAGAETIDCGGATLAPAIVDLGVFAIDLPAFHAGGIVRVGLMPDQSPVLDDPGIVQRAALIGRPGLWIHPIAAATRGLAGTDLAEMAINRDAGARAVGTGARWIADSGVMRKVLAYAGDLGLSVITHAEDGGVTAGAVATAGETATRMGLPSAPSIGEALAIARDLMLTEETGATLHIRQVTTAAGFELVRAAKRRGVRVTCGITPAHLLLSDIAMTDFRTFAHLSPPLRSESDRQAAVAALADGTIDVLCSGHDPRGPEEKRLPFADSASGMAGAETLLALGLGLVRDETISLQRLFALLAANPAKVLGVEAGSLGVGAPADLLLLAPEAPWQIAGDRLHAKAGNTPFDGLPVQGKVLRLFKGGTALPVPA
ncbi:dihydroorotase [Sphingomonas sp. 10B4]|uniref:dihydroorotase n=1 Tax=Sphingomonas sp. 10B4 TaxID=3048575 RepID=UPI002AB588BE|nr:amidohydrolase family protein [Sphingomonas sp. 10B4]MDY7525555.1 amidohydrolase family protein [Sphingomonas sp. 10B4]MEB0282568.1 amidohydrolase family protein [Sphingomonas sp. 10B4]